jgi:hypothetical protein
LFAWFFCNSETESLATTAAARNLLKQKKKKKKQKKNGLWLCYGGALQGEKTLFKSFTHRFPTPYNASNSTDPVYYAIKRGPAHIIVLSSYSAYGEQNLIDPSPNS